jgi:hypothetical protein
MFNYVAKSKLHMSTFFQSNYPKVHINHDFFNYFISYRCLITVYCYHWCRLLFNVNVVCYLIWMSSAIQFYVVCYSIWCHLLINLISSAVQFDIVCYSIYRMGTLEWFVVHFQQYLSYIVAVDLNGVGNRSTRRKPPTCRKSLTDLIT